MWTKEEFLNYLKLIGKFPYWDEHIYPSMRKNILAVTNASLEDTELEMNTFELNGADFLLSYDFDVLLLEINATPDLSYSTSVTENICRRVMEDIVKGICTLNLYTF
jgi:tubulin monoglycylase TTLL3/8